MREIMFWNDLEENRHYLERDGIKEEVPPLTREYIGELAAENSRLWERILELEKEGDAALYSEAYTQYENVKLRKLVHDILPFIAEEIGLCVTSDCFMFEECCEDTSVGPCPAVGCIRRRALELGIEAPDE